MAEITSAHGAREGSACALLARMASSLASVPRAKPPSTPLASIPLPLIPMPISTPVASPLGVLIALITPAGARIGAMGAVAMTGVFGFGIGVRGVGAGVLGEIVVAGGRGVDGGGAVGGVGGAAVLLH